MLSTVFSRPIRRYRATLPRPGLLSRLVEIDRAFRHKRTLERLDNHLRRDVGLNELDVKTEMERPVWDIPAWWK